MRYLNGLALALALNVVLYPIAARIAPDWGLLTITWWIAWGYLLGVGIGLVHYRLIDQ